MFNKTYTSQINELLNLISAGFNLQPQTTDEGLKYRDKKFIDYVGRQVSSSSVPYSGLLKRLWRIPADVLTTMGFSEREARELAESEGDYSKLKWFIKRDSSTYSGDGANESLPYSDEDFNKANPVIQYLQNIMDKSLKEIVPLNLGGKLPAQVEHITNHVITYPQKEGFDLFSTRGISESNNYKVLDVQAAIGKILPSPPDIIRGSVFPNLQSKDFIPKKLDKNEYNTLKVYTNTVELKYKGKNMNIREAINAEIDSDYVQVRLSSIKKFGLDSEEGKRFSEEVFQVLSKINTKFIKAGMIEYMLNEMPEEDRNNRINAVENKNIKFNDILLEEFERLNLGTFSNSSF